MAVHKDPWPPGTPAWVDITVSDLTRSQDFYRNVLGWDFTESNPEEFGGYTNALVRGELAAGMSPPMEGADAPHFWTTYLSADDSAATAAAVTAAGGSQLMAPMQVGPFGTMALYADPTGAIFGTWQAGEHTGYDIYGEPGAVAWSEAMVGDFEVGKEFYSKVFGYTYQDMSSDDLVYAMFTVPAGGQPAGGIGRADEGQPAYWSVTFAVDDCDAALARATDLGATVLMQPYDFEYGRIAVVTGPDGEPFGILAEAPQAEAPV